MEAELQDYINSLCCTAVPLAYNFDVNSTSWSSEGITDKATFEDTFNVTCGAFVLTGDSNIKAEILTTTYNKLTFLNVGVNSVISVNYISIVGLVILELDENQLTTFNPSIALPSSLTYLYLSENQLTTFNPSIALPSSLTYLNLARNQLTTASYTQMEQWANLQPAFTNPCSIYFDGNIDSVTGTNLETILLTKNAAILS